VSRSLVMCVTLAANRERAILTGPLDDLYDLRQVVRENAPADFEPGDASPEWITARVHDVLKHAGEALWDCRKPRHQQPPCNHVYMASFGNGDRVAFVAGAPWGVSMEAAGRAALRLDAASGTEDLARAAGR